MPEGFVVGAPLVGARLEGTTSFDEKQGGSQYENPKVHLLMPSAMQFTTRLY